MVVLFSQHHGRRTEPENREITNNTRNKKNMNFAIPAAPAAIPPNPNIAATMATTRKLWRQQEI
jgi:hypothetical protein